MNTVPSFHIGTVDVSVTNSQFIRLYDSHNGIDFIIDTASPKSIVPIHMFPSLQNNNISCELLSADGHPLQQAGSIDLTLRFDDFPSKQFVHTFILANIYNPILGLDFLKKYQITIDTNLLKVSIADTVLTEKHIPDLQEIDYDSHSLDNILALFPDLISGEIRSSVKIHPFEHQLDVSGSPIAFRPRRLNPEKTKELNSQIDELLRLNIIRSSTSPWASPVHLVKKKDDSYRLVIDYRAINQKTAKMNYPLPRLQDFTAYVNGCTVFSCLDLKSAFWQLDVRATDRKYTAFCTHRGNFEFNRMPFGLTYASSSFQHFINNVLIGTDSYCFAFVDDIFIFSKTLNAHKRHLHDIANRLNAYGLTLNIKKCILGVNKIDVLGYRLSADGILPLPDKISAIKNFPQPTTIKELRRFLGLIAYQRRFIKNAAFILDPLNFFLKGRVKNNDRLQWTDKANEAFIAIKRKLVDITYLAHPKEGAVLQLKCDASNVSLGACLEQVYDKKTEVLGYFSRSLQDAQRRYSTYDLELLSVYNSVKYFQHMLLDKHFIIFTDNKSLVNSFCKPSENHTPRQVRQLSYLSQFDCEIRHLPGHINVVADCLSRVIIQNLFWAEKPPFTLEELVKAQQRYQVHQDIPSNSNIQLKYLSLPNSNKTILIDCSTGTNRPLVPPSLQSRLIKHYHNMAHVGIRATRRLIQSRYVFPSMKKKIRDYVNTCIGCQRSKVTRHIVSPLTPIPVPNERFHTIHVDICGPFPPSQTYTHLLVCVDRFSRWVEAYPMPDQTTNSVICAFNKHLQTFGACSVIHTDSGCQFTSAMFRDYCQFIGANHRISSVRYPQSNGLAERMIRSIKTALTAKLDKNHWTYHLPFIILSLNSMYKEDLKCCSAELVYGQSLRLPGDLCVDTTPSEHVFRDDMVAKMRQFARECRTSETRVAQNPEVHLPRSLQTCTHVFIKNDPIKSNLTPTYDGPFEVRSRTDKTFSVIRRDKLQSVSINNVKPACILSPLPDCVNPNESDLSVNLRQNRRFNLRPTCHRPSRYND